ncbi:hypothetical protein B0J14DRAFT_568679 [Halenospora varia]|nr:hypothetical protein B0J14DRAFT_568679 [Halenospora varia]
MGANFLLPRAGCPSAPVICFSAETLEKHTAKYLHAILLRYENSQKECQLLPAALKEAGVVFQEPIATRTKTLESALGSLERRRDGRMKRLILKNRMEKMDWSWDEYWNYRKKPDRINDIGEFPDLNSMFDALHDIGGIRILVYFPSHVEEVVKTLEKLEGIEVIRIVKRGQKLAPDMYELKRFVNELEGKPEQDDLVDDRIFSGYRATHAHVCLCNEPRVLIEVQIATVVMNAWSQVEHDIIYKPAKKPSKEEMRILDTFNGVVMIGENAMIQLEEMLARKEQARVIDSTTFATGLYDIGKWIEIHCADKNFNPLKGKSQMWNYLQQLLDVLRAEDEHTSGKLKQLIDGLSENEVDETVFSSELPLHLMNQCHKVHKNPIANSPKFWVSSDFQAERQMARYLAFRVVQTLNIVAYLGIEKDLILAIKRYLPSGVTRVNSPTMTNFLDILHPDYCRVHFMADEKINKFCRGFLDGEKLLEFWRNSKPRDRPSHPLALMALPMKLVEMSLVAYPREWLHDGTAAPDEHTSQTEIIIPRSLCELLNDPEHTHWVPELCSTAAILKNVKDEHEIPFEYLFSQSGSEEVTPLVWPSSTRSVTTETQDKFAKTGILTYEDSIGGITFRMQSGGQRPRTWWEINVREGKDTLAEYHADKQASRPRPHPGYLRAFRHPDAKSPKWEYIKAMPKAWELKKENPIETTLNIDRLSERKDELVDLANSLIKVGGLKYNKKLDDGTNYYTLTLEDVEFCLLSREAEFVLYRGSIHQQKNARNGDAIEKLGDSAKNEFDLEENTSRSSNKTDTSNIAQ